MAAPDNAFRRQQLGGLNTEAQCWRLYIDHGMTQRQVAEAVGVSAGAVSKALKRAERRALESMAATITSHKMIALQRHERLYQIAMDAYASSVGERVRSRTKLRKTADGDVSESQRDVEVMHGNPRFLAEARAQIEGIRKLLGLDAPVKVQQVDPERPFKDLTDDEVRRELAATLRAAGVDPASLADEPGGVH